MKYHKNPLVYEYWSFLILATTIFASGCAHSPLFKEWDTKIKPDFSTLDQRDRDWKDSINKKLKSKKINRYTSENYTTNDVILVDFYDENGKKTGSAEVR